KYAEARTFFFQLFKRKQDAPVDLLVLLCNADSIRLDSLDRTEKVSLAHDLLETIGIIYQRQPDPFWLYRSGQISLLIGDDARTADFFRRAYSAAPVDAHYRGAAKMYYQRLERAK